MEVPVVALEQSGIVPAAADNGCVDGGVLISSERVKTHGRRTGQGFERAEKTLHKSLHKNQPTLPNEANGCRLPHV